MTLKGGQDLPVRGRAWVIVAPPHFSPHTQNLVTLEDVMIEAALEHGLVWPVGDFGPRPSDADPVSFTHDIYPILHRLGMYRWVSDRARRGHAPEPAAAPEEPEEEGLLPHPVSTAWARAVRVSRVSGDDRQSGQAVQQAHGAYLAPAAAPEAPEGDPEAGRDPMADFALVNSEELRELIKAAADPHYFRSVTELATHAFGYAKRPHVVQEDRRREAAAEAPEEAGRDRRQHEAYRQQKAADLAG